MIRMNKWVFVLLVILFLVIGTLINMWYTQSDIKQWHNNAMKWADRSLELQQENSHLIENNKKLVDKIGYKEALKIVLED